MKLVRFHNGGTIRAGKLDADRINELQGDLLYDLVETDQFRSRSALRLAAPCQPGKVVGLAINYPGATGRSQDMTEPLVFLKPATSVIGPEDVIHCPFEDAQVWGETELAVVIGRTLRNASIAQAKASIFGYAIANDVSAENIHGWDHHLARSKGIDTFCVIGPWIDSDYDPANRTIESLQNGELLRQGNTDDRLWKEPELLSWLSSWMTLEAGDVILTGAPTRVRDRLYLHEGDVFTCRITGLGELNNQFSSKART